MSNSDRGVDHGAVYKTFDVLRFPLILLVIYIHNYDSDMVIGQGVVSVGAHDRAQMFVENVFSQGVARIAVPLFFLMSGYLFFFNSAFGLATYRKKLGARLHTLLIPFLFWNVAWLLFKLMLQMLPFASQFINARNEPILSYTPFEVVDAILGITHDPNAYQFWFIRDLMVLVVLSPLVHLVVRGRGVWSLVIVGAWWFTKWPVYEPSLEPLLFFGLGGAMGLRNWSPSLTVNRLFLVVAGLLALGLFALAAGLFPEAHGNPVQRTGILAGLVWMLCAGRALLSRAAVANGLVALSPAAFFVFATHEPILTIVRKLIYKVMPGKEVYHIIAYALLPLMIAAIMAAAYFALLRVLPRFTRFVTGGRG